MYQSILTKRYLTSKVMPLLSAGAVMLCAAMVLIVWSVMGGFLTRLLDSGRTLMGDVEINWPSSGFAYYEELIADLKKDPRIEAATPMVETLGLISLPDDRIEPIQIRAIDPATYASVVSLKEMLWWKPLTEPLRKDTTRGDDRLNERYAERMQQAFEQGLAMSKPDPVTGQPLPAAILGIEMSGFSKRDSSGIYKRRGLLRPRGDGGTDDKFLWMPNEQVTIRVLPLDEGGREIALVPKTLPVANEFRSGIFDIDKRTIFIPLSVGQEIMKMRSADALDASFNPYDFAGGDAQAVNPAAIGKTPARVNTVLVKGKDGVTSNEVREICLGVYARFADRYRGKVPSMFDMDRQIKTWEMRQAQFIGAVKKETALVLTLLTFISFTASFMILAIFWAMIAEKTKDIGVLRALGASQPGIAWIWIRYGMAIGLVGSLAGVGLAYLIVTNINPIHEAMGTLLGIQIWDASVYYFAEIPNKVDPVRAMVVFVGGLVLSLIGAVVPAIRAALLDPVKALRFE